MKRQIGIFGTSAREILGTWLVGSALDGHQVRGPFESLLWILGLLIIPAIFLTWQWARARRNPAKLRVNGPIASTINVIIFFYFWLWAPSSIAFMPDAVVIFYGVAMLIAAIRGYAGCESLAISNCYSSATISSAAWPFHPSILSSEGCEINPAMSKHQAAPSKTFENDKQTSQPLLN